MFANAIAARSHAHREGIYVYNAPAQLLELLKCKLPEPPAPEPPVEQAQELIEAVRRLTVATTSSNAK